MFPGGASPSADGQFANDAEIPCFRRRLPQDRPMRQPTIAPRVAAEAATSVEGRIGALDWNRMASDLGERGYATTGRLLTAAPHRSGGAAGTKGRRARPFTASSSMPMLRT